MGYLRANLPILGRLRRGRQFERGPSLEMDMLGARLLAEIAVCETHYAPLRELPRRSRRGPEKA